MKKLKLIISFILLVSLFLGVAACTPDEESKADVSEAVSDEVSEEYDESVNFDDVSLSDNEIIVKYPNDKKVILDTTKDDGRFLVFVHHHLCPKSKVFKEFENEYGYKYIDNLTLPNIDDDLKKLEDKIFQDYFGQIKNDNIYSKYNVIFDENKVFFTGDFWNEYYLHFVAYVNEEEFSELQNELKNEEEKYHLIQKWQHELSYREDENIWVTGSYTYNE